MIQICAGCGNETSCPKCRPISNEWVKCSERLPQPAINAPVIVIVASYSTERKIYHISAAEFQRGKFYDRYNERMPIDDPYWPITHWMPLPPVPETPE
jgi:hypothetical protein